MTDLIRQGYTESQKHFKILQKFAGLQRYVSLKIQGSNRQST